MTDLTRKYGIHRQTVNDHLRRCSLAKPVNIFTPTQGHRAAEFYKGGMTLVEVAAVIGSNTRSATLALDERGIPRRPRGQRRPRAA